MNLPIIIVIAAAIVFACLMYFGIKNAQEVDENERPITKFEPRKVVDLSPPTSINLAKKDVTPVSTKEAVAPKKKKKRYYTKKKPAVAQNAIVEKRPVGRPKKTN